MTADTPGACSRSRRLRIRGAVLVGATTLLLGSQASGLVSSNDGSHVALARAFIRGRTSIDSDVALTLGIDYAARDGHAYSDRPPGTAWLAMPAVGLGHLLDEPLFQLSRRRGELLWMPVSPAFARTYGARTEHPPPLRERLGTAWAVTTHALAIGLVGWGVTAMLLRRLGYCTSTVALVIVALVFASLWGPYSTVLFSHATAAFGVAVVLLLGLSLRPDGEVAPRTRTRAALVLGSATGLVIATEYTLLLPLAFGLTWTLPRRSYGWIVLGAALPLLALGLYHHLAFGTPWSVGYQHHAHFHFARAATSTFSGDPVAGLWTLLGTGHGAGLLAMAPLWLVAMLGCVWAPSYAQKWVLAFAPWLLLLALHQTPFGGGTLDHRYLVPALPVLAVGLAAAIDRMIARHRVHLGALILVGLFVVSAYRVWSHFLAWHDGSWFGGMPAAVVSAVVLAAVGAWVGPRSFDAIADSRPKEVNG